MKRLSLFLLFTAVSILAFGENDPGNKNDGNSPPPCHTAILSGQNVSCYGGSNGQATVTINRPGTYDIIWSNGTFVDNTTSLTNTISGLSAGYYDVQVIDVVSGCSAFDIINITQPPLLKTSKTFENVKCFGMSTGSINLTVTGGTINYTYNWSSGQNTQDLANLAIGNYYVTVMDSKGCIAKDTVSITQPAQAVGQSLTYQNPKCTGSSDGSIDLTVWGGTAPYVYNWNDSADFSQDLNGIPSGSYSVVITDANLCTLSTMATLTNPPVLVTSITSTDNLCYGETQGSIDMEASGGTPPYSYSWANSDYILSWPTEDLTGLSNYKYYVTITDANGCLRVDSALISSPPEIQSSITATDVTTFGGMNGAITLNVTGGVLPYSFIWSNGSSNQNLSGIPSNWYYVTITDAHGCTREDSVFIKEPLSALVVGLTANNALCFGSSTGSIFSVAAGGTPPYNFIWSTGDTTESVSDVSAGVYTITVYDFYGNFVSDSVEVLQPDPITFTYAVGSITCSGLNNGSIDITMVGGTPPFTYQWMNSEYVLAALTEDISGMPADQYYLEVIDSLGCRGSISITINQPPALNIQITHTDVSCAGGATGTADCIITGGTLPYSYLWSGGQQTSGITNLAAGVYSVTVTDSNNCLVSDSVRINQTDSVSVSYTTTPVSCVDQHDGKISVTASGGNGDYTYLWSNGAIIPDIEELYAGTYVITVTDFMGCVGVKSVTVTKSEVDCINIPTCFTPNGDGFNDTWHIKDAELYPEFFLEVYDRWGLLLYSLNGTYEQWDGTYKGKPLPSETYYYFLRLTSESSVIQGNITIVR
ncbi:MAG TPA: T9SS type B sorting domain-containing protein [Bacteroidales bacterium]|nr:T9SS type B sorting domain-containing protein [Bacteroidales bacterium]